MFQDIKAQLARAAQLAERETWNTEWCFKQAWIAEQSGWTEIALDYLEQALDSEREAMIYRSVAGLGQ